MKEGYNKSKNISIIISSDGNNKEAWENLLNNIISNDSNINNDIISNIYQFLIEKTKIEINLDILDFIVQYGSSSIIELFVNKNLSKQILELLKNNSKSSVNVQKKIIFLIQKWAKKYEKEKEQINSVFINNYKSLKKAGIMFPPDNFKMTTYEKYISDEEAQNIINEVKNENKFANPFLSEMIETNIKGEKKIFTNESCLKKKLDIDNEENPYNQDNKINNNIKNNNNFNNNSNNMDSRGMPGNNNIGLNEQKSRYPKFPSQFKNDIMNNLGKNNNTRKNNNNNSKNQFPNYNNSCNNNMNSNFNKINNNNNNNYNRNNNYNNYTNNYNNNINNNNSNNNNNFNNINSLNYNRSNTNYYYNNNKIINNNKNFNNNFSSQKNNNLNDFISYKKTLGNRLLQLNSWIDESIYSANLCKLKEGIIEIINEMPKCENMMNKCKMNNDKKGYETYRNMKMDMEQTCARYEDLVNNRKVDPFRSSFFGNSRQYYFNKSQMFGNNKINVPNNFNDYYYKNMNYNYGSTNPNSYGASYNRNNYDEREVSVEDKLVEYGGKVKDGFCYVGGKIKDTAISGFNFVKNKINEDDDLADI